MQIKKEKLEINSFLNNKKEEKIRKRGCRFSKCNQHLRPLLLLHAIKELQSQQKHRNATLFFHKHQHDKTQKKHKNTNDEFQKIIAILLTLVQS